ncbi:MAG: chromate transporter [Bacillaceae bacterium]|nr:chromate transporter [Bacillaceae bacterium]
MIPLVHKEVVQVFEWMTDEEFTDMVALGNALPGPINTKMVGYIGYKVGGVIGMINAVLASITPSIILLTVFLTSLSSYREKSWVVGMTRGVMPVVVVMIGSLTWRFVKESRRGLNTVSVIILIITSFLLIEVFYIHPAIVIALLLSYALLKPVKKTSKEKGEKVE